MKENTKKIIKFIFITIFVPIYIAVLIYESQQLDNMTKKQLKYFDNTMESVTQYNNYKAKILESNYNILKIAIEPVTNNIHSFLNNKELKDNDFILDKYIKSLNTKEFNTTSITKYIKQKKDYESKMKKELLNIQENYMFLRIYSNSDMENLTDKLNELLQQSDKVIKMLEKVEKIYGTYLDSFINLNKVYGSLRTKKELRAQYYNQYKQLNDDVKQEIKELEKATKTINQLEKEVNTVFYKTMHSQINANSLSKIFWATFKTPDGDIFREKTYSQD